MRPTTFPYCGAFSKQNGFNLDVKGHVKLRTYYKTFFDPSVFPPFISPALPDLNFWKTCSLEGEVT